MQSLETTLFEERETLNIDRYALYSQLDWQGYELQVWAKTNGVPDHRLSELCENIVSITHTAEKLGFVVEFRILPYTYSHVAAEFTFRR